jgi:hypothetical protein
MGWNSWTKLGKPPSVSTPRFSTWHPKRNEPLTRKDFRKAKPTAPSKPDTPPIENKGKTEKYDFG